MSNVAIVTDSTADIPGELADQLGISVVPLNIRIGRDSYEDRVSIMPDTFMQMLDAEDELPATASPSVGRFAGEYERLGETHDAILSIHVSSKLSGTYASACTARDLFLDGPEIRVIDSGTASMGLGLIALAAAKRASDGASIDEIQAHITAMLRRTHVIFLVDTLEHLRRGGRIGRAAEIIGSVLQLKPLLRIEEGIVVPHARTRTRARAVSGLVHLIEEVPRLESAAIMHTSGAEDIGRLAETLTPKLSENDLIIAELSPVLSAHIGPKGLGVAIVEEE
ncbi:MAG: DegV family protein [Thermomicrobiaceae bacterium]